MNDTLDMALIGTPKSGTSSLFGWLDAHPRLQGSQPKETFFFMDASHPMCGRHGLSLHGDGIASYERFFSGCCDGRLRFDGNIHTFYQRSAITHFAGYDAPPLCVCVLRSPAERIYSSFMYTKDNLSIVDRSLEFPYYVECLLTGRMEAIRGHYRSESSFWIAANELSISNYVEWLRLWREAVGRDRLMLVAFKNLKQDPGGVVRDICRRLDIDSDIYDTFSFASRNVTVRARSHLLNRWVRQLAPYLPAGYVTRRLRQYYRRLQHVQKNMPVGRDQRTQEAISCLHAYFEPMNVALEREFGAGLL